MVSDLLTASCSDYALSQYWDKGRDDSDNSGFAMWESHIVQRKASPLLQPSSSPERRAYPCPQWSFERVRQLATEVGVGYCSVAYKSLAG